MKTRLVPLYFEIGHDEDCDIQLARLKSLLADEAGFLEPLPFGAELHEADAVIFPQFLGQAFKVLNDFKAIDIPILVITSEFGTVQMWDWEICNYLCNEGVNVIAPHSLEKTKKACRMLSLKRELQETKFLIYQDDPGEGMPSEIFKRFYWLEDECKTRMVQKFGIQLVNISFKELGAYAHIIPDEAADKVIDQWDKNILHNSLAC